MFPAAACLLFRCQLNGAIVTGYVVFYIVALSAAAFLCYSRCLFHVPSSLREEDIYAVAVFSLYI